MMAPMIPQTEPLAWNDLMHDAAYLRAPAASPGAMALAPMKKPRTRRARGFLSKRFAYAVQGLPGRPVTHLSSWQRAPGSASMKQVDT